MVRTFVFFLFFINVAAFTSSWNGSYKEHYKLTRMRIDLLIANGKGTYGETNLKPIDVILEREEFYLHFLFANEFFSSGEKTKAYPRYGSKGPIDTIGFMHVKLVTRDSIISLDSILHYVIDGNRVILEEPHPFPGMYACISNPKPEFRSIDDFIAKYNSRHDAVLFDELTGNGVVLKGTITDLPDVHIGKIISVMSFTNGKMLADTLDVGLLGGD